MRTEARGHSAYYFFIVIVIRYETTATARWALPLIVRTLFNDAITVAVWTCFHVCLPANTSASLDASSVLSTGYFATGSECLSPERRKYGRGFLGLRIKVSVHVVTLLSIGPPPMYDHQYSEQLNNQAEHPENVSFRKPRIRSQDARAGRKDRYYPAPSGPPELSIAWLPCGCYALSVEANIFAIILLVGAQGLEPWTR